MDKMKMICEDGVNNNIGRIAQLFPNVITERKNDQGEIEPAIDFDMLRQELSKEIVEGPEERYQFTWPDKRKSIRLASSPIAATLRPCREESVDFDTTQNLYIEGDNLDVLKLLRETYLGKVKMIYIDPPYNTGNDFVYEDDFAEDREKFLFRDNQYDEQGNRMVTNTNANGRFHTDWLNMIYPRLRIAKDLLTDDGVIFISIDDNEQENLKKITDEIFGSSNFIAQLVWERAYAPKNDAKYISNSHDYILMYGKSIDNFTIGRLARTDKANARYSNPDNDSRGVWKSSDLSVKTYTESCDYPITLPSGRIIEPPTGRCWRLSKNAFMEKINDNRIWFGPTGDSTPSIKRFLAELKFEGMAPTSILFYKDVGHSQEGSKEVTKLLNSGVFNDPKPVRLLLRLLTLANASHDSIIFDFFSGSATTAHAVMQRNAEDGGNRKFIMVQVPELIDEKSEDYKAGYKNICEIGKERIRRAGTKIKEENKDTAENLDIGFRVLKLDSTNMEEVYYNPQETRQDDLLSLVDNIKSDRTPEDLLFQIMLEFGILPSSKIEKTKISGKEVFNVSDNFLIACFDKDITDEVVTGIAQQKPNYVVLRDSSFATDNVAANYEQIFLTYSPDTVRRVL